MTSVTNSVRTNRNLKDDATELFRSGIEGMPFRPRHVYNEATEKAFIEVEQMEKDPNLKGYSVQEALRELKNDVVPNRNS